MLKKKKVRRNRKVKEPLSARAVRLAAASLKLMAAAAVVAGASYSIYKAWGWATTTERLAIRNIGVTGAELVSEEEVRRLSGIRQGDNLLAVSVKRAVRGVKRSPWVESVKVRRDFPDGVSIDIKEREPVALVKLDELYVMDGKGVVFKKFSKEEGLDLPIVTGLKVAGLNTEGAGTEGLEEALLELIGVLKGREGFNLSSVSEIRVDPAHGLTLYTLNEGVSVDIGKGGFAEKLSALEKVLDARGGLQGIEAIDLNNSRKVIVRFTENVVSEGGVI